MRKIAITKINATTPLGSIEVASDLTQVFKGQFYRHPTTGEVVPSYTTPAPAGYTLIKATTFDVVDNPKYAGRYTVYTPLSADGTTSSIYASGTTRITVNEGIPALATGEDASLATSGFITNISTYLLITGAETIIIPPAVTITSRPIDFMGRDTTGWGESFAQNFLDIATNFANAEAPANPFIGQTWYDTDDKQVRVWNGTTWDLLNRASFGVTHRHTQGSPATIWNITHGLGLSAPYITMCQFYVDRGNGPQIIIPSNVQFLNANQMRVTFSNPEVGYAMVRP